MKRRTTRSSVPAGVTGGVDPAFAAIAAAFAKCRGVTTGRMFGSDGLKVDSKVFAMAVKGKLVVKLPAELVESLIASGEGDAFDPGHGRRMKEWVAIAPGTASAWLKHAEAAFTFVSGGRQR